MALARFDNIIAIKTETGRVVGYHARNLQVAELDAAVWNALNCPESAGHDVKAEIVEWNQETDPAVADESAPTGVRTLYVNVAQICNMRCSYCAAGGDGTFGSKTKHIDLETIKKQFEMLLAQTGDGESFAISFFGGEPLVYPETVREIARHARLLVASRGIELSFDITTNATLVTPKVAEMLADLNATVKVSIDAAPEVNDRFRKTAGGLGSSALTLKGLENLIAVKGRLGALASNSVFGPHNTDVVGTYMFLKQYPWDSMRFEFAAGPEDEIHSPRYVEGLRNVARLAWSEGGEKELRRIGVYDMYFRMLDGRRRLLNHCQAGKSSLQVDTRGRFFPCIWSAKNADEEVGRGLELDAEALSKYAMSLVDRHNCGGCWARHLCGGGCMYVNQVRSGDKHKKDEQFCYRTRALIAIGIEYYERARNEDGQGA